MEQRTLQEHEIIWEQNERMVSIDGHEIQLTTTQYHFLIPLLEGRALSYGEIAKRVYHCAFDQRMRRMFDKHIERIRVKMQKMQSPLRIYTIPTYGYILLSGAPPGELIGKRSAQL